ncbi:MAG: hypothetical protein ABIH11_09130 [Candidatus Altiarchaeota archaeon]
MEVKVILLLLAGSIIAHYLISGFSGDDGTQSTTTSTVPIIGEVPANWSIFIKRYPYCRKHGIDNGWIWYTTPWNSSYCLPSSFDACIYYDGYWGVIGNSTEKVCNPRAYDYGKECIDSVECLGDCVADLDSEQLKDILFYGNKTLLTSGHCSEYVITTGPAAIVRMRTVSEITIFE